jgi:hypothetical protein
VASVEDLKEMKVSVLFEVTSGLSVNEPFSVLLLVEIFFTLPLGVVSPGFSTSPVANPVFVSRVDKYFNISVVENRTNLGHEVGHPVTQQEGVNELFALNPLTAGDTQSFLNCCVVHENIGLTEIVAKRRLFARNTDVIDIEFWVEGVSNDTVGEELAEFGCSDFEFESSLGA